MNPDRQRSGSPVDSPAGDVDCSWFSSGDGDPCFFLDNDRHLLNVLVSRNYNRTFREPHSLADDVPFDRKCGNCHMMSLDFVSCTAVAVGVGLFFSSATTGLEISGSAGLLLTFLLYLQQPPPSVEEGGRVALWGDQW